MRKLGGVLVVSLFAVAAGAQAPPVRPEPAASDAALAAFRARDAAEAFAKAAPRKNTEKLPEYVGARRGSSFVRPGPR